MKFQLIQSFLMTVAFLIAPATATAMSQGKLKGQDATIYVRKKVTAGGTVKLLDGQTFKVVGRTNIDGNKFDDYRNLVIQALSIKYGTATTASATDAAIIDYTAANIPATLRNAELSIVQGNRSVVNIPIMSLTPGKNASPSSLDAERFALQTWAFIKEGQNFDINIEFASGSTFGAEDHFVEVGLFGVETSLKS